MPRRAAPGRTPAREADAPFDEAGRPSKTQRKKESADLQTLGAELVALPDGAFAALPVSEALREAMVEYRRTRSHEGRRRQMQYIGRLMRGVDDAPLREAVAQARLGGARDALQLHQAEAWRAQLLAGDDALTLWAREHPDSDLQQLRTLVRAARVQAKPEEGSGAAARQARSFRELFRFIRSSLQA
ncbi:MAG: ribosome biogenesis factor YjgA [Rubrivivax sp.]